MKNLQCHVLLGALVGAALALGQAQAASTNSDDNESFDSPRLAAVAKQLTVGDERGNHNAIETFLKELRGKAPLVEPVAEDAHSSWITFVWRGDDKTRGVTVLGGPPSAGFGAKLERLKETDLWYRTERVPNDARFGYRFIVNLPERIPEDSASAAKFWKDHPFHIDPLNRQGVPGDVASLAELPGAPPQPWLQRVPGVSNRITSWLDKKLSGRDIKEATLKSELLKQDRTYAVYTPPNYDPTGPLCNLLVMFDGNGCRNTNENPFPVPIILDHLIAEKKIPPHVAVFVHQTAERDKELACSETFADFVAKELLPVVRKDYRVSEEAARTTVCGLSLGGLMSSYCAYRHSEVFGNVLSLSGSYQWHPGAFDGTAPPDAEPGWLTRQFVASPKLPVRFYLAAGRFENFFPRSLLGENRRLRDVLEAKGYEVKFCEFSGGHDPVGWRGPFVEGMIALVGKEEQK